MPLTSPCLLGSNSFSPIKVNATSAPALALELIARILELGRETPQRGERDYTFLLTAALVSKTWSNEARPLLWKFVVVHWESEAKRVLSSSAWGLYQTQSLVVNYGVLPGLEGVAETSLRQLNCGTEGLQRLDIAGYSMLAPAVPLENLCVPALRNLVALALSNVEVCADGPQSPVSAPYSLRSLQLLSCSITSQNPYSFFTSPYLTHLDYHSHAEPHIPLKTSSPFFVRLQLNFDLFTLEITTFFPNYYHAFQTVPIYQISLSNVTNLTPVLHLHSLEKFSIFNPCYLSRSAFMRVSGGQELVAEMEGRGIAIHFAD